LVGDEDGWPPCALEPTYPLLLAGVSVARVSAAELLLGLAWAVEAVEAG
jgi:hypothetical protein